MFEETPFSIRKEIEQFHGDEAIDNLVDRYSDPPRELPKPAQSSGAGQGSAGFIQHLLMLQNGLQAIKSDQDAIKRHVSSLGDTAPVPAVADKNGVSFNIGPEVLKWVCFLIAIVAIVWFLTAGSKKKKSRGNPLRKRLTKVERQMKQMRYMRRSKTRRVRANPSIEIDDVDDDDDEEDELFG